MTEPITLPHGACARGNDVHNTLEQQVGLKGIPNQNMWRAYLIQQCSSHKLLTAAE